MAYVPVNFELHDFQLSLDTMASAKFHKRMKELGFDTRQQGDTLTFGRGKCLITAFVVNGASLTFLPDFYDDTPGGTVYAIMEKMCMAFGGTMIGKYTIPGVNNQWDVRISQGMNLSGKADVGSRDYVVDENAAGNLAPSSAAPVRTGSGAAQQTGGTQQAGAQSGGQGGQSPSAGGNGQVADGQQGESQRDKLYRVLVEEAYQKHAAENGEDPNMYINLIRAFNQQFPKEEEAQQAPSSPKWEELSTLLMNEFGLMITTDPKSNAQLLADHINGFSLDYLADAINDSVSIFSESLDFEEAAHIIDAQLKGFGLTFDVERFIKDFD